MRIAVLGGGPGGLYFSILMKKANPAADITVCERNFLPKIKVEVAIDDSKCEEVIEVIIRVANTGKIGDGKIFLLDLSEVIRIRTGEKGSDAL